MMAMATISFTCPVSLMVVNASSGCPIAVAKRLMKSQHAVAKSVTKLVSRNIKKKSLKTSSAATRGGMSSISRLIRYRQTRTSQTIVGSRNSTNGMETIFQNSRSKGGVSLKPDSPRLISERKRNSPTQKKVARRVFANKGERQARLIHMAENIHNLRSGVTMAAKPLNKGGFYG